MNVKDETHARSCARVPRVMTDAMYAMLCKNILSDNAEHRDSDLEEAEQRDAMQPSEYCHETYMIQDTFDVPALNDVFLDSNSAL